MVENVIDLKKIAKALSNPTRVKIIKLTQETRYHVSKLAELLEQTEANVSAQVKKLEEAGLVSCEFVKGEHGVKKLVKGKDVLGLTESLKVIANTET